MKYSLSIINFKKNNNMACEITSGLNAQICRENTGGVIEFYVANFENVASVTEANSSVTAITMEAAKLFQVFKPNKNSSNWEQPIEGSVEAGTIGYTHTCTMVFSKNQSADINTLKLLAKGNLMIIVRERSGRFYLLGKTEGLQLTEGNFASGTALADANAWTLTFSGSEPEPAPEVLSSIISALLPA